MVSSSSSLNTLLSSTSSSSSPSFPFPALSFTGTTVKLVGIFTPCALAVSCLSRSYLFPFFPSRLFFHCSSCLSLPPSYNWQSALLLNSPTQLFVCLFRIAALVYLILQGRRLVLFLTFCSYRSDSAVHPCDSNLPTHFPNKERPDCPAQRGQISQNQTLGENMTCICAHEYVPECRTSA